MIGVDATINVGNRVGLGYYLLAETARNLTPLTRTPFLSNSSRKFLFLIHSLTHFLFLLHHQLRILLLHVCFRCCECSRWGFLQQGLERPLRPSAPSSVAVRDIQYGGLECRESTIPRTRTWRRGGRNNLSGRLLVSDTIIFRWECIQYSRKQ